MKRLIFIAITFVFLQQARAQLTANFTPSMGMCPWPMLPASGAYEKEDEEDRKTRMSKEIKKRVKKEEAKIKEIDNMLAELQGKIDARLNSKVSEKAIEYMQGDANPTDVDRDCRESRQASAGSTPSDVPTPKEGTNPANEDGSAPAEQAVLPVDEFCDGPLAAAWRRNIGPRGKVQPGICQESSQLVIRSGSFAHAAECARAIRQYKDLFDRRKAVEKDLADAKDDQFKLKFGDLDSDIEGDCVDCRKRGNGLSTASSNQWMNLFGTVLKVGVPAVLDYYNQKQWRKTYTAAHTYEVDNCSRLGYPSQFCYGQSSLAQRWLGHQQQPYPSTLPGYMGNYNGVYGAVPGGVGNGSFGCNPGGMNQYGMPTTNSLGGVPLQNTNLWGQNYPPGTAPFNGGQGPWGSTPQPGFNGTGSPPGVIPLQNGSPGYNPYLLNSELSLINSRMGGTGGPPPILPYPGITNPTPVVADDPSTLFAPIGNGVVNGR